MTHYLLLLPQIKKNQDLKEDSLHNLLLFYYETLIKKFHGFSKKRVGDRADGYDKSLFEISPEEVIQRLNDLL